MNDLVRRLSIPNELKGFIEQPCLLPGENRRDYEFLHQMMIDDIQPRTNIEWLWTFDLIELSWEVLRYRRLKQKVLETNRGSGDPIYFVGSRWRGPAGRHVGGVTIGE